MFSNSNELFIFVKTDCPLVEMTSYCANTNHNFCVAVVLESIIILIANSLPIKILLHCFLARQLVHIYVFYELKDILM